MDRLVRTRGNALATVSDSFYLSGFAEGDSVVYEIDHSENTIDENDEVYARFADNPFPSIDPVGGFRVEVLPEGTDGTQLRLLVTYLGSGETDDEYMYVDSDDGYMEYAGGYAYESGGPQGVVAWRRTGFLSDDAYGG